jgi:hypothetical protein
MPRFLRAILLALLLAAGVAAAQDQPKTKSAAEISREKHRAESSANFDAHPPFPPGAGQ